MGYIPISEWPKLMDKVMVLCLVGILVGGYNIIIGNYGFVQDENPCCCPQYLEQPSEGV